MYVASVDYVVAIDFAESVSASSGKSMCAVRERGKTLREREKTHLSHKTARIETT
jgi:hypothetical protein